MKFLRAAYLIFLLLWSSFGETSDFLEKLNQLSNTEFSLTDFEEVPAAVASITRRLENQGMEVIGIIDHKANAEKVGLELPPSQLILFRDPYIDPYLVSRSSTIAIDLPQKILVWEDAITGKLNLLYNPAGYLFDRHGLKSLNLWSFRIDRRLQQFGNLENGLIHVGSNFPTIEETVENLQNVLTENGFSIPFTLNFTQKNVKNNLRNSAQLIIFGNPNVGTLLMQNKLSIGIDLPLKFLVWEDSKGQVSISYNDLFFLGKRHNLQGMETLLETISSRLQGLANVEPINQ